MLVTSPVDLIKLHEALRLKPNVDTTGHLTIGWGYNLEQGLPLDICETLLERTFTIALVEARAFPWYHPLNTPRKAIILDMLYNLGLSKFRGFAKMRAALDAGDTDVAAEEMLNSKWAGQVGQRAHRLSLMMRSGEWPAV